MIFLLQIILCDWSPERERERERESERERLGLKIGIYPDALKKISKNHFVSNLVYIMVYRE